MSPPVGQSGAIGHSIDDTAAAAAVELFLEQFSEPLRDGLPGCAGWSKQSNGVNRPITARRAGPSMTLRVIAAT